MSELWPVVIISLILAAFSAISSKYDSQLGKYEKKDFFFYIIMAVIMIGFVGLRTKYNDTITYVETYEYLVDSTKPALSKIDWSLGSNPGFELTMWFLKYSGVSAQSFLMIFAIITIGIYLWFLRKYTSNIWLSVFLFFTMGVFTFTLAAIKQCVAVAFCLLAVDRAINKKWISFVLWILIAVLFHPYAIMYLIVPFMMYCPWTKKTYWSLIAFGIGGISLQFLIGRIIDITSLMGEGYDANSFSGEGVNPFRLAVCAVPLILSFILKNKIFENENDNDNDKSNFLFLNLSILNAEIMFIGLFGTANYFARLANYFLIFQIISLPWLFKFIEGKSKTIITTAAIICYLFYFYYSNMYSGFNVFDIEYNRISFFEYIKEILS